MDLKETVDGIEHSIPLPPNKYNAVISRMTQRDEEIKEPGKRVETVERREKNMQRQKLSNERNRNEIEWRSRRQNLGTSRHPDDQRREQNGKSKQCSKDSKRAGVDP